MLQDLIAMAALLAVVIANVIIGFWQEYKAERALTALRSFEVVNATVMRGGEQSVVNSVELVPGDIVILDEGMTVRGEPTNQQ